MKSEKEIIDHLKVLEKQRKDYHQIASKDFSIGAITALYMEHKLDRQIGVLKWVLEKD